MNFENQIIFFFSALGAFNGFILSIYLAIIAKKKKFSNYFLVFLLLMLSIRIIKSVFFYFNPQLSGIFIQIGLSALILIGPFLYLYLKSYTKNTQVNWVVHVLPFLIGITVLGTFYPYVEHRTIWSKWIVKGINYQWLLYILLSFPYVKSSFKKIWKKDQSPGNMDVWLLSVFLGTTCIWFAYKFGVYTSYITGALSFSFVLYLIILLLIFRNSKKSTFFQTRKKYKNKEIENDMMEEIEQKLSLLAQNEMFLNPNLTLDQAAKDLDISKHLLSQYLNEKLGKSFSTYINEFRIEKAKEFLNTEHPYTIETLGYESGFNSKSTFFTTFKKLTGQTPAEYRRTKGF